MMRYSWKQLYESIQGCEQCALSGGRQNIVIGEGNAHADVMFIGEGPGREEDEQGRPFVGPAGQLLTRMIEAINLKREEVYIANIVKCRPPNNRTPLDEEAKACIGYLRAQTALVRPRIIVCLGATAARHIVNPNARITRDRGTWKESSGTGIILTYHPAALLRDPGKKREAWEDMKAIAARLARIKHEA